MRVRWSTPAHRDILRIAAYYRNIDPELSARMRERVDAAVARLISLRSIARLGSDGLTRKWRAKGTPLLIFFVVQADELIVTRIRDQREDWILEF